jgi:hypothetical protein
MLSPLMPFSASVLAELITENSLFSVITASKATGQPAVAITNPLAGAPAACRATGRYKVREDGFSVISERGKAARDAR